MKEWTTKLWGRTRELYRDQRSGVHLIEINANGFCSEHKHTYLSNEFYVLQGSLGIVIYENNSNSKLIRLCKDESFKVDAGVWHRFINDDCLTKCLEIYETVEHSGNDITRRDEGGPDAFKTPINLLNSVKNCNSCCCPPCSNNTEYCCNGN